MNIVTDQVVILAILALIGAISYKVRVLNDVGQQAMAKLVVNLTLPLLIISSILKIDITIDIFKNSITILLFSYVSLFLLFLSGKIFSRLLKHTGYNVKVHTVCTMFGNIVFIGYPLFNVLYPGGEGVLYAAIYHLASDTLLWTYAVITLSNENINNNSSSTRSLFFKKLLNPNFIAFTLAIILVSFKFKLPHIIEVPFSGIGGTTLYLAMLYIGAMLVKSNIFKKRISLKESIVLALNKMFLIPIVLILLMKAVEIIFAIKINGTVMTVLSLQTAIPTMAIIAILVKEEGAEQVSVNIFITTLISLISLPFMFYLINSLI